METLMQPDGLRARVLVWAEEQMRLDRLPQRSGQLLQQGVFVSDSPRAPLRLAFPATLASRWMPGLFPDQPR